VRLTLFLGNKLRARKYRFAVCFRVLSNQYVERCLCECFQVYQREWTFWGRCFDWCPAAMLESLRRAPATWRLHTKHYNFQWYLLPNNSSSEYCTSPKPRHVVYLLLFYDILIFWLNLSNVLAILFSTCVIINLTCVTWKPPIRGWPEFKLCLTSCISLLY